LKTARLAADGGGIAAAAALVRAGRLVAFGTETVYGLGADATNGAAVAGIFAAKRRPHFNPLICHFATPTGAWQHVLPDERALVLAEKFWPGPLTLVLKRRAGTPVALLTGAGLECLAVRVPAHPVALALLDGCGVPVAAPSANLSGQVSPTTAQHVLDGLDGLIDAVLECGPCPVGVESTVLDLTGAQARLLRPGGATSEAIARLIGPLAAPEGGVLRGPGMLASHYAPTLPVRLAADHGGGDEALLAFGGIVPDAPLTYNLSASGDLVEAASRLFAGLRWLDREGQNSGLRGIAAMPIPGTGLGSAINDRLIRAASPR
jgi:L-threonylcarbamoyladenylate synthase